MAIETYMISEFAEYGELFGPFWGEEHLMGYESLDEFASAMQDAQVRARRRYRLAIGIANEQHDARRILEKNSAPSEMVHERAKVACEASDTAKSAEHTMTRAIQRANASGFLAEGKYERAYGILENFRILNSKGDLTKAHE